MKNISTRLLLTLAAIGVAGTLVVVPTSYLGSLLLAVAPFAYGLVTGAYLLPGVIAQSLFRRPGFALVTATLSGLITAPFIPNGVQYIAAFALIGAIQEVPFAVSAYRYWRGWVFYAAAGVFGVLTGVVVFIAFAGEQAPMWMRVAQPLAFLIGFVVFTWVGRIIALGVERTGAVRGLQRASAREASARGAAAREGAAHEPAATPAPAPRASAAAGDQPGDHR